MAVKTQKKSGKLDFKYLPGFAGYILENYHEEFVREQLRLSKEVNLPLLSLLDQLGEKKLIEMSLVTTREFLTYLINNDAQKQIDESFRRWMTDKLPMLSRDQIISDDITLINYIRKQAFLKFVTSYTSDIQEIISVVQEIDIFLLESETVSITGYIKLLKNRINEEILFKEKISNTTPGIVYVYDLVEKMTLYVNDKVGYYLGYDEKDHPEGNGSQPGMILHPDDVSRTTEHVRELNTLHDQEIRTFEYRAKSKGGTYCWFRAYESVFRRKDNGHCWQVIGTAIDINNEKIIEEQLFYREAQLLEAQEIAHLGSYEWDLSTGNSQVTPELTKILELENTPLETFMANVHPGDRKLVEAALQEAMEKTGNYDAEFRYIINGKEKIIWSRGVVAFDENGAAHTMRGTVTDVTERHHIIQRLQTSEDLYKQAQAATHIGNWTWEVQNNVIHWSDELYRIYGLEPQSEKITFERFLSFVHPDDRQKHVNELSRITNEPGSLEYLLRIDTKNGIRILQGKSTMLADEEGRGYQMIGSCQDITDFQLLIERLQQSDELYKQAQALSHIGNWSIDFESNTTYWTDEMYRIYGLEPQSIQLTFETFLELVHPDDRRLVIAFTQQAIKAKTPFDMYHRNQWKDGTVKSLHIRGEVVTDESGKVKKLFGTAQDVTQQQLTEQQLRENRNFIQKIADATPSIIASYNINTGKYRFVSQGISKLLGYDPDVAMENGVSFFTALIHPDDLPAVMEKNAAALQAANESDSELNDIIVEWQYRMRHNNGEYRWFHTFGTIFDRNSEGKVEHVLNISIDITDKIEAERKVQQKTIELEQSNASLEEFAYVASHDLKEPLRKISTFGDRLINTQKDRLDPEGKNFLEKIVQSSRRMQQLINDLLSVSLITAEKKYEQTSLQALLNDVILTLEDKIEENKTILDIQPLPEARVIPSQFRQVFQNLMSNSLKFIKPGTQPKISVRYDYVQPEKLAVTNITKANRYLRIRFSDNGIGFEDAFSDKIFAIFHRLHNKSEFEGTGIGLSICKKIIENHGGVIIADGKLDKGATFTIIIPV